MSRKPVRTRKPRPRTPAATAKALDSERPIRWLGGFITFGFLAVWLTSLTWSLDRQKHALEARAARAGGVLSWTGGSHGFDWTFILLMAPLIGIFLWLPWAYGLGVRPSPVAGPHARRSAVIGTSAVIVICSIATFFSFDVTGGYTLEQQAVWLEGGREVARQEWSRADSIVVGCKPGGQHESIRLVYSVVFSNGRRAHLGDFADSSAFPRRFAEIERIDALLPTIRRDRVGVDEDCLSRFTAEVAPEAAGRLRRLLAGDSGEPLQAQLPTSVHSIQAAGAPSTK